MTITLEAPERAPHCSYCGREGDFRHHSGRRECGGCWDYRKLDRPAALHWAKVLPPVWSNVDMYDSMNFFPDAGAESPWALVNPAVAVYVRSALLLKHGPEHTWPSKVWDTLCKDWGKCYLFEELDIVPESER